MFNSPNMYVSEVTILVLLLVINCALGLENQRSEFLILRKYKNSTEFHAEIGANKAYYQANAGDLIYGSRQPADIMLVRDVFVVAEETGLEQEIQWTFSSNARYISTVRMLNFGDQKAFCSSIYVTHGQGTVVFIIPASTNPRVILEAYGQ
ncbi:uncharacterized protein LOC109546957 [Dendroctonus ponderosae]|uniref:uncharacterized protein LOC109546957 n=1 Tax=Dendroctonus ponderosae TaxID=77166 RepID=UPI00203559A1|nr:uncharacterized protein LOC109546957 [Dendroctonus ponderosae]